MPTLLNPSARQGGGIRDGGSRGIGAAVSRCRDGASVSFTYGGFGSGPGPRRQLDAHAIACAPAALTDAMRAA